jgi:hypothetical protein
MLILPNAQIFRADASPIFYRYCFADYQGCPTYCPAAKMDEMPIIGKTILAAVLAHRRYQYPVAEGNTPHGEGAE